MTQADLSRSPSPPASPARLAADARRRTIVGALKLVLPLAGLGLLSSMFLLSEQVDPERALPFARVDVEALAIQPRIEAARFAAMTADGAAISFIAGSVRSDTGGGRLFTADDVVATVETPDGNENRLAARSGVIDRDRETLELSGDVQIMIAAGYAIESDRLTGRLDRTWLASPGPVIARAPGTVITADRMEIRRLEPDSATATDPISPAYGVVFSGRVHLLYDPTAEE